MIIGFDGSRAFALNKTGTENYSYQVLKALSEIDKINKYIVYLRPRTNAGKNWPANFTFKHILWPRFWTQVGLASKTFQDKLDVLFVPAHTLPIIRKSGLKTVITVHDLGSEYLPSMHQLKQKVYLSIMQKHQLKTVSKIIAVSKATKEDLINKIGISKDKIKVIYEGYDKNKFSAKQGSSFGQKVDSKVNSLKQYDIEKGKYFLFVGTIQPRKNLTRVIQAFSRVILNEAKRSEGSLANASHIRDRSFGLCSQDDKINLVIAGSKGWLSEEIFALPKKLGIEDRVKFLGYVPDSDLPALYNGAKAFLFPSLFEGFGLPILEAQACGCPVITSNISSMPEIAGSPAGEGAILVDPYSIDDIVKGMYSVNFEGESEKLVKKGLENIKRFSWEKCARETLDVLEETGRS